MRNIEITVVNPPQRIASITVQRGYTDADADARIEAAGLLRAANNLRELDDAAEARENLSVYSRHEIDYSLWFVNAELQSLRDDLDILARDFNDEVDSLLDTLNEHAAAFISINDELELLDNRVHLNDLKVTGADRLKLDGSNDFTGTLIFKPAGNTNAGVLLTPQNTGTVTDRFAFTIGTTRVALFDIRGGANTGVNFGRTGSTPVSVDVLRIGDSDNLGTTAAILVKDAAHTLALRNGANAQTLNIYNTFTDAANYERGFVRWSANVFEIGTTGAGTGSVFRKLKLAADKIDIISTGNAPVVFGTSNSGRWQILNSGHLVPGPDVAANQMDIGSTSALVRSGYFGTSVVTPKVNFSAALTPTGSADATGATGDVRYDDNFVYVKASTGWKRAALNTF